MFKSTNKDMTPAHPRQRLEGCPPSPDARRELIAHWMSDIHAVPDHPALRRLPDGTIFHIDDLSDALRLLDAPPKGGATIIPFARSRAQDEGDDPPGASAMWPTLPPIVIDARATHQERT